MLEWREAPIRVRRPAMTPPIGPNFAIAELIPPLVVGLGLDLLLLLKDRLRSKGCGLR